MMTKQEKIVVSAYTGVLMCDFHDVHKYIEEKLGRPVWTHEIGFEIVKDEIRKATKDDFLALCGYEADENDSGWIVLDITPEIDRSEPREYAVLRHIVWQCSGCLETVKEKTTFCPHCGKKNIKDEA